MDSFGAGKAEPSASAFARVLMVDDDEPVVRPLIRGLKSAGFVVEYAPSGAAALDLLHTATIQNNCFHALITDVQMPRLRGDILQRMARQHDPDLAVMLLSAFEDMALAVACMREGVADYVTKPFQIDDVVVRLHAALEKHRNIREVREYQTLLEKRVAERTAQLQNQFLRALESLNCALEAKDAYTNEHSARVCRFALALVHRLRPSDTLLRDRVDTAARLHDIGKIGVSEAVINKPGRLSSEEFSQIRKHPAIGNEILFPLVRDPGVLEIIRHHHEYWNGLGYPDGLAGEAIPLGARILAVVDAFDAMTSSRPYRQAMPVSHAVAILSEGAGKQWDPQTVYAFVELLSELDFLPEQNPFRMASHLPACPMPVSCP